MNSSNECGTCEEGRKVGGCGREEMSDVFESEMRWSVRGM